jgi:hypothetical protein
VEELRLRILEILTIGEQIANPEDWVRAPAIYDAVCKHWTEVGDKNGQPDYKLHKLQQVYRIARKRNPPEANKTQKRFGEKVFQEFMRDEMLATISKSDGDTKLRDCYTNVVLRA